MSSKPVTVSFSADLLKLDLPADLERTCERIRTQIFRTLKRKGAVVGLSGGIDSSVSAALCARAIGPERVIGLLMPEAESSRDSTELGRLVGKQLGIRTILEDITPVLQAAGCYSRKDAAIRSVYPAYGPGFKSKVVLPDVLTNDGYKLSSLVVETPAGERSTVRLTAEAYLTIVAATNFKQRARKMMEYYYADASQYAVVGTPNRLEYDQGFFVKNGDGAADLKPIAHLYKSQVYELAAVLGIPDEVRLRTPTTDTYSLEQTQEEFYFSLPLDKLDLCLYALDHGVAAADVAAAVSLTTDQVERVYRDIASKRKATEYLHLEPLTIPSRG